MILPGATGDEPCDGLRPVAPDLRIADGPVIRL